MEDILKAWKTSRKLYADFLDKYSIDQLNKIPDGFNNNLIWNIGHIITSQQFLIYGLSNLQMHVPSGLFDLYKPGTKPTRPISQDEANELKALLTSLVEQTEKDLSAGKFVTFTERMTITGFHLTSLRDALEFNNYHEGLHMGYMLAIRKFV